MMPNGNGNSFMPAVQPEIPPIDPGNMNPYVEIPTMVTVGAFPDRKKSFFTIRSGQTTLTIVCDPDMLIKWGHMFVEKGREARSGLIVPGNGHVPSE